MSDETDALLSFSAASSYSSSASSTVSASTPVRHSALASMTDRWPSPIGRPATSQLRQSQSFDGGVFAFSPSRSAAGGGHDDTSSSFGDRRRGVASDVDDDDYDGDSSGMNNSGADVEHTTATTATNKNKNNSSNENNDNDVTIEKGGGCWRTVSLWLSPNDEGDADEFCRWDEARATVTVLAGLGAFLIPFAASMMLPTQGIIQRLWGWQPVLASIALQIFSVLAGVAPVFISPWGDRFGRKPIMTLSLLLFTVLQLASGFAPSLDLLIVGRALSGAAISSVYAVGTGCIYDVFRPRDRALGLGLLVAPAALGALLGPVAGGFATTTLGWRFTLWLPAALAVPVLLLYVLWLPETLPDKLLHAVQPSRNPLLAVRDYLLHPRIFWIATSRALATAEVFSFFVLSQAVLIAHHFGPDLLGVSSIPYGVGSIVGGLFGGKIGDRLAAACGPAMRLGLAVITDGCNTALFMAWALIISYWNAWVAIAMTLLMGMFNGTARSASYAAMIATEPRRAATITGIAQLWTFLFVGLGSYLSPLLVHTTGTIVPVFTIFTFVVSASLLPELYIFFKELYWADDEKPPSPAVNINVEPSEPDTPLLLAASQPAQIRVPSWRRRLISAGTTEHTGHSFVGRQASLSDILAVSGSQGTAFFTQG